MDQRAARQAPSALRFWGRPAVRFTPDSPDGLAIGQPPTPISGKRSGSYARSGSRILTDAKGERGNLQIRQCFRSLRACRPDPNGESGLILWHDAKRTPERERECRAILTSPQASAFEQPA